MKKRCYIAAPFFYPIAVQEVELIKKILKEFDIEFFSPKDDNLILPDADSETRKKGFWKNINEIDGCNFMIANTRDKDIGTSVEIGIAFTKKIPVILFTPQIRGQPINLMLSQLFRGFSFDVNELQKRVREYLEGSISPEFEGKIE